MALAYRIESLHAVQPGLQPGNLRPVQHGNAAVRLLHHLAGSLGGGRLGVLARDLAAVDDPLQLDAHLHDAALAQALTDGTIAGAALDVFESEPPPADYPLLKAPNTVFTPHLGASTEEAQETVGIDIAEVIKAHLLQGTVVNAVNMPNVDPKVLAEIGPFLKFGELLGRLVSQFAPARSNVVRINYSGKVGSGLPMK